MLAGLRESIANYGKYYPLYKTEMRTLILSTVLYLLGIASILLVKPTLMFNKDGSWKEFGIESPNHTLFPFWLFCIVWAIVSYILTLLTMGEYSTVATATCTATALNPKQYTDYPPPEEDLVEPLPIKTKSRRKNIIERSEVGYHMLNKEATEKSGVPQYIYVGDKPLKKPGYYVLNKDREDSNPKYDYVGDDSSEDE